MKKFLFTMMAALLVCGMSFAQSFGVNNSKQRVAGMVNDQNIDRGGWIGNTSSDYVIPLTAGKFAVFAPRVVEPNVSGTITKIKIGVCNWPNFNGGQMRVSLYPAATLTQLAGYNGIYEIPTLGTEISGIDIDVTSSVPVQSQHGAVAEVEFDTPMQVPTGDFWVVVTALEPICLLHSEDGGVPGELYYAYDATTASQGALEWVFFNNEDTNDDGETVYGCLTFQMFVDDGGTYVEQYDLKPMFANEAFDALLTSVNLGEGEDLVFVPFVDNEGPDAVPATAEIDIDLVVIANGEEHPVIENWNPNDDDDPEDLPVGYGYVYGAQDPQNYTITLTYDELMEMVGNASDFVVQLSVYTEGDPNHDNDVAQLLVTVAHFFPVQNLVATPEGNNVVLTWDAPEEGGVAPAGYLIYRDGTQIGMQSASQPTTKTDANVPDGTHEYCVVAKYPGTDNISEEVCVSVTLDGINEMAENIAVYPNPASSSVKVANAEGANIRVINSVGQVVANIEAANAMQEINVEGLAEGVYTIRIASDSNVVTKQFCVSK